MTLQHSSARLGSWSVLLCAVGLSACHSAAKPSFVHSTSITTSADGSRLYVVNADADSVSVIDTAARVLVGEILLATAPPAVDPTSGAFTPAVMPRALALSKDGRTLYVSGERSGLLYAVDVATLAVRGSVGVGSEPVGVVVAPDGDAIYVACSQDATVVRLDAKTLQVTGSANVAAKPWALAFSSDGAHLWATHLLSSSVSQIDPKRLTVATMTIPDTAPRGDRRLAHGQPRGLYDVAPRPGTDDLWIAHVLLGTDTSQPLLDFESTAFPAVTVLRGDGSFVHTVSTDAPDVPGVDGSFTDVVSGPHALAFLADGTFALMVDSNSEDLLAIDAERGIEAGLMRPLPGHMPEGIALAPDESVAYVDERNSGAVDVVRLTRSAAGLTMAVDGDPIARMASDPMPASLRLGQHLFYSANSDELPLTKNHWIACATCHMEGGSDAVTWLFAQGPRDTPSNAGGTLGTGFLFRTADRNRVQDYWHTINVEQGGNFNPMVASQASLLDTLADYVNHAIPLPVPPTTDPTLVARGAEIFNRSDVGCSGCHAGARFTDSGTGNPTLDLAGTILLHDVGTCVSGGAFPDVAHQDVDGNARAACLFDTPSLSGVSDSAPYLHDGSAATLHDVLEHTRGHMGDISSLSSDDEDALVEFLRSL